MFDYPTWATAMKAAPDAGGAEFARLPAAYSAPCCVRARQQLEHIEWTGGVPVGWGMGDLPSVGTARISRLLVLIGSAERERFDCDRITPWRDAILLPDVTTNAKLRPCAS